jgi:hypothetical protein
MKKLFVIPGAIILFMFTTALTNMNNVKDHNNTYIKTDKLDQITQTSVRCFFSLAGNNMSQAGVCMNLTGNPTTPSKIDIPLYVPVTILNSVKPKQFNVGVKGLSHNTTYYIRCYVKNNDGTIAYGNQLSFKTLPKQ